MRTKIYDSEDEAREKLLATLLARAAQLQEHGQVEEARLEDVLFGGGL